MGKAKGLQLVKGPEVRTVHEPAGFRGGSEVEMQEEAESSLAQAQHSTQAPGLDRDSEGLHRCADWRRPLSWVCGERAVSLGHQAI